MNLKLISAGEDKLVAKSIIEMLKKIDITVQLQILPKNQLLEQFLLKKADLMVFRKSSPAHLAEELLESMLLTPNQFKQVGVSNAGGYSNPIVDALVFACRTELNPKRRQVLLHEAAKIARKDVALVPLFWPKKNWVMKEGVTIKKALNLIQL